MGQGWSPTESLGYALKHVQALLRAEMDAGLRPLGLTVPQYACMTALARRPGQSSADLARAAFVSRQSMNVLLTAMEKNGWVEPMPERRPGRARPYRLTVVGRSALESANEVVRAVEDRMVRYVDDTQQAELHTLLNECVRGLSEA